MKIASGASFLGYYSWDGNWFPGSVMDGLAGEESDKQNGSEGLFVRDPDQGILLVIIHSS